MAQLDAPVTSPSPVRTRIRGIDLARALAIVGMVMVHIGPVRDAGGGVLGAAYRATHGRAAIGFIVLAGLGVSLLAGDRSAGRLEHATTTLAWRALILFPAGLALQTLDTNVAVILQYYAVFFLVAAAAMRLSDRGLVLVAATSVTVGPILLLWLERTAAHLFQPGVPQWHNLVRIARDVLVTGYYPVVVWTAPLVVGIWLGRRNLRSHAVQRALAAGGAAVAAGGFILSEVLVAALGPPAFPGDWRTLYVIEPHNEMPLWVLTATGIAVAVTGLCLLAARAAPTASWPLVALGQLALTAYVLHLIVLDVWPQWLVRDGVMSAWVSVARFTAVAALAATAYRSVATRGPFELLLRAPTSGHSQR